MCGLGGTGMSPARTAHRQTRMSIPPRTKRKDKEPRQAPRTLESLHHNFRCYNGVMSDRVPCDLCGREVDVHASYVVRMDVFADPSVPPMTTDQIEAADFGQALDDLVEQMNGMTADDLQDTVHRRFEFRLCPACQ